MSTPNTGEHQKTIDRAEKHKSELVREVVQKIVLAILDHRSPVELKRYKKSINWSHPPKKFGKKEKFEYKVSGAYDHVGKNEISRNKFKNVIHEGLKEAGIDKHDTSESRITTAVKAIALKYKFHPEGEDVDTYISRDDFLERMKNGKLIDDVRALFGVRLLMRGQEKKDRKSTLDALFSDGNFMSLFSGSEANKSLYSIIEAGKKVLRGDEFKEFKKMVYRISKSIPTGIDTKDTQ